MKKEVTKEEFDKFIENYPTPLKVDIWHAFTPPLVTYNDFSDGKVWPESIVANYLDNRAMDGYFGDERDDEPIKYFLNIHDKY